MDGGRETVMYSSLASHWHHFEPVSMTSHKHMLPSQPKSADIFHHLLHRWPHPHENHIRQVSDMLTPKASPMGKTADRAREQMGSPRPQ